MRLLFGGTVGQEEPGVKAAGGEGRRHPAADKRKIVRVQAQPNVIEESGPVHSTRFQIVEQRRALTDSQGLCTSREQHLNFFKQLTRGATDHCGALRVITVKDGYFSIKVLALTSGKRAIPSEKSQLRA